MCTDHLTHINDVLCNSRLKNVYTFVTLYLSLLVWFKFFNRCKAIIDHFGQRISANYFIVEDSYLSESVCRNVCYRYVVKQ